MGTTTLKPPHELAEQRRAGKAYALEDVAKYLAARAVGKPTVRPLTTRWRK